MNRTTKMRIWWGLAAGLFAMGALFGAVGTGLPATGGEPRCGGVILGFDQYKQPIMPTPEFYKSRQAAPRSKATQYSFVIDSSVTNANPSAGPYLLDLFNTVAPYIPLFYGPPPDPGLVITVRYDTTYPGWYFYDASTNSILISGFPRSFYDDDGDGRVDEDPANDPVYDSVLLHELTHSFHDDFGLFASWAEEGMNECATELVAEYLYRQLIRDVRDRKPRENLLYFDTWDAMGPDVVGGTAYSLYKSMPDMFYRQAPGLFFLLCATQSPGFGTDMNGYTFLKDLNASLRARLTAPMVTEDQFYEALDAACIRPEDGVWPVSRWVRNRAVANTVSRPGAFLGIYPAYGLTSTGGSYFTMVNPAWFNVFAFQREVSPYPWFTQEHLLTGATPVYVNIYNANGSLVWSAVSGGNPYVTLTDPWGYNWIPIGRTETWPTGWYRIEAHGQWPGYGYLSAENYFLVLGPGWNAGHVLDESAEGAGVIGLGAGDTIPARFYAAGAGTLLPWQSGWALLARPQDLNLFPATARLDLEGETREVSLPYPYTRVLPLRDRAVFVPDVRGSDLEYTGISIVNGGVNPAECRLDWLDGTGAPVAGAGAVNPVAVSLGSGDLALNMATGFFQTGTDVPGWVRIASDGPVEAFSLNGDLAGYYLDGTPALADLSTRWLATTLLTDWGAQNRLVVVNPYSAGTSFSLDLYHADSGWQPVATGSGWVNGHGQTELDLAEVFPARYIAETDYVRLRANAPVAITGQMTNGDFLATLPLVPQRDLVAVTADPALPVPAPADLFAPQFAAGGGWWTRLTLLNTDSTAACSVILTAHFSAGGAPQSAVVNLTLDPGQKRVDDVQALFNLSPGGSILDGWIQVRCSRGLVQGAVQYGDTAGTFLSAQPLARNALKRMLFGHIAIGEVGGIDYFTGMALLNPSDNPNDPPAHVTVILHNAAGDEILLPRDLTIPPGVRISDMIAGPQYFPQLGPTLGGWIEVQSDQGLFGYVLFGDSTGEFLSAVPPMPLE